MKKKDIIKVMPNSITLARVIMTIILTVLLFENSCTIVEFICLNSLIFISDILDGKVARYYNVTSKMGEIFDIVSDVFYILATSIAMKEKVYIFFLIIAFVEFIVFIITSMYLKDNKRYIVFDALGRALAVLYYAVPFILYVTFQVNKILYNFLCKYGLIFLFILTLLIIIHRIKLCFVNLQFKY